MSHRHVVLLSSIAVLLAACGGADHSPPRAPDARAERAEPEPTSIEEAQARIERARASLGGVALSAPATGASSTSPTPITPSAPPEPSKTASEPRPSSKKPEAPSEADTMQKADDRCASPCRALVSMRRAVTALCRMTGEGDTRCVDAKKTLADSEGRVSPCSC